MSFADAIIKLRNGKPLGERKNRSEQDDDVRYSPVL